MTKIAFLGTGIMGQGMARNLLKAGFELTAWNRTASKARPLAEAGAIHADSPRDAVQDADFIIAMVGDDRASRDVWLGAEGVLAGAPRRDAIAIESSTLSLAWVAELGEALAAAGLAFIDSPVTGGREGAEQGTLALLVGAAEGTLAKARPVMNAYSREIVHFGPPGSGTAYKLVVNLMVGVQATALAEGLLLAGKLGLDLEQVIQCLGSGAAGSPIVRSYARRMASGDHGGPIGFSARWLHKDMEYALRSANEVGQAMPTSAVAAQIYQMALARGLADMNATAVVEGLR